MSGCNYVNDIQGRTVPPHGRDRLSTGIDDSLFIDEGHGMKKGGSETSGAENGNGKRAPEKHLTDLPDIGVRP